MIYIDKKPNPGGAYPNAKNQPFPDCLALTEEQSSVFFEYNGFVFVTETEDGVTVEPNTEAWAAWKAAHPETNQEVEEPTELEQLRADVDFIAAMTGVEL